MIECRECGAETLEFVGDTWEAVCRECREDLAETAAWLAEDEATGN